PGEAYSYDVWAPELVYLQGDWYIYVAATSAPGANPTHRMYVLKADTQDPLGSWTMMGKVFDPENDKWAIDGAPFEYNGQLYFVWSGWPGDVGDFPQNTYIASMSDPLTLSSPRVLISEPDQPWERSVAAINEGQEPFVHGDSLSIVYSADASWTSAYKLGVLHLTGDDPLDPAAWTKIGPVFEQNGTTYGPGHNSMPVTSPDGSEYWLIYHAKTVPSDGWGDRAIFAQEFTWNEDGTPNFGTLIPRETAQPVPAGESCGEITSENEAAAGLNEFDESFIDLGESVVRTVTSFSVAAWVQVENTDQPMAFVSQDGGITSNFVLGMADGAFHFSMFDGMGQNGVSATAPLTVEAGRWVHLTGVRDLLAGELQLYVDGELQGSATFAQDWDARANTILGGARSRSQRVDLMTGALSGVRFFSGALDANEVAAIAAENMPE
ncbi:MAG: family 43 glycosylhydrolase, partial [Anaerolineae bacterium]|nr:family 43 glycosylhydrolase [Anaerolineae bacterium]